jgi:Protein of unknown function (DUF1071)
VSELLKINVNDHTEKKNGLTYLSWSWAWAEVLKIDPQATWEAVEFNGLPCAFLPDSSAMVKTVVTIKGHSKSCWLPVMNHRNQAIKGPDAFAINTAIVRCLTKAISMHGLGLYIYAGEDLPEEDDSKQKPVQISPVKESAKANPITEQEAAYVMEVGGEMVDLFHKGQEMNALMLWRNISDNAIKMHLWDWLQGESKLRAFLKANKT